MQSNCTCQPMLVIVKYVFLVRCVLAIFLYYFHNNLLNFSFFPELFCFSYRIKLVSHYLNIFTCLLRCKILQFNVIMLFFFQKKVNSCNYTTPRHNVFVNLQLFCCVHKTKYFSEQPGDPSADFFIFFNMSTNSTI